MIDAQYRAALDALVALLTAVQEQHWATIIQRDLTALTQHQRVTFPNNFGGMGSLDDLLLCATNHHTVAPLQEPWAQCLLGELCRIGLTAARTLLDTRASDTPAASSLLQLCGWRCVDCGYAQTTAWDIEMALAQLQVPRALAQACRNNTLVHTTATILQSAPQQFTAERHQLQQLIARAAITLVDGQSGHFSPCPQCHSDNQREARWTPQRKWFRQRLEHV